MIFENEYFQKMDFSGRQIENYLKSAKRNIEIAQSSEIPEVISEFSYNALIKFGICLIARKGYRIKNVPGHHWKIIEKMTEILVNKDIEVIGNQMRQKRNFNFYGEGFLISQKDAIECFNFVKLIIYK